MNKSGIYIEDSFTSLAKPLRKHFDDLYKNPHDTRASRFVWDYWHVPNQYTNLRTPAWEFFPKKIYEPFHKSLVQWGRENLGCHDISPPWLSCYVEGCYQDWHCDLPHGPWAYVFSLTPWKGRNFTGGETTLLQPEILSYWNYFSGVKHKEREKIIQTIEPKFNRLIVFDPRVPHSVSEVNGTRDPKEGRLVIHGWFVQPKPVIYGPIPFKELSSWIGELSNSLNFAISEHEMTAYGYCSFRIQVAASGVVTNVRLVAHSLKSPSSPPNEVERMLKWIAGIMKTWRFKRQREGSVITLPLTFEN